MYMNNYILILDVNSDVMAWILHVKWLHELQNFSFFPFLFFLLIFFSLFCSCIVFASSHDLWSEN